MLRYTCSLASDKLQKLSGRTIGALRRSYQLALSQPRDVEVHAASVGYISTVELDYLTNQKLLLYVIALGGASMAYIYPALCKMQPIFTSPLSEVCFA